MRRGIYVFDIRCRDAQAGRYSIGHAFGVEAGKRQFLITTLHQIFHCSSNEHLQILWGEKWVMLPVSIVKLDLGGDVAAFRIEVDMGIRNVPLKCLDSTGLKVGQEVVVMRSLAENTPWPKGTYVGRCQLGEGDLWFDGFSQRGMSGSPICYHDEDYPGEPRIAGVLKGLDQNATLGVSLVRACDVTYVVEALKKEMKSPSCD